MQTDALIKELLATSGMNEDTAADLQRMLAEFEAGKLDPDDASYIAALHARLTGAPLVEPEPVPVADLSLDGLTIAEWRDRALAAEAELSTLKASSPSIVG